MFRPVTYSGDCALSYVERNLSYMEQESPSAADIAETFRLAMEATGTSLGDLSELSGVPLTALTATLAGESLGWEELVAISMALGRTASSVIAETEQRKALA